MFSCLFVARSSPCTGVTAAVGSDFGNHIWVGQRLARTFPKCKSRSCSNGASLLTAKKVNTSVPDVCNSAQFVYMLVVQGYRLQQTEISPNSESHLHEYRSCQLMLGRASASVVTQPRGPGLFFILLLLRCCRRRTWCSSSAELLFPLIVISACYF